MTPWGDPGERGPASDVLLPLLGAGWRWLARRWQGLWCGPVPLDPFGLVCLGLTAAFLAVVSWEIVTGQGLL